MKKVIIPVLALLMVSVASNAQMKTTPKAATTASSKTTVAKPGGSTTSVSPAKTSGATVATTSTTKSTGIKRKHPRKAKKAKAKKQ